MLALANESYVAGGNVSLHSLLYLSGDKQLWWWNVQVSVMWNVQVSVMSEMKILVCLYLVGVGFFLLPGLYWQFLADFLISCKIFLPCVLLQQIGFPEDVQTYQDLVYIIPLSPFINSTEPKEGIN